MNISLLKPKFKDIIYNTRVKIEWSFSKFIAIILGKTYNRNGLPLTCCRYDGVWLEHEHADHPEYRFPIVLDEIDRPEEYNYYPSDDPNVEPKRMPDWLINYESHPEPAYLGIKDGKIWTIYETCFSVFNLETGISEGGFFKDGKYKIQDKYLKQIYDNIYNEKISKHWITKNY